MPEATSVGFVGLGNLGQPMAMNLLERGCQLKVVDRDPARLDAPLEAGAEAVDTEALAEAPVICFAVPDEVTIRTVLEAGLLDRLTPEHVLLVHSTVLPASARELADWIEARSGAHYLDVPVSGGAERARRGKLALFVGGDESDVTKVRPVLDSLGENLFHLGPIGAGSAAKLANQLIMFSALAGVHEALRLTASMGLSDAKVLEAVASGTGDTWVGRNWGFFDRTAADYDRAGVPLEDRPWTKDLWEIVASARHEGVSLPVAGLLSQTLAAVIEGHARSDRPASGETTP